MPYSKSTYYFLIASILASILLVYFIVEPFLIPLILAAVFAYLFQPIYSKFLSWTKNRKSISALFSTLVALIILILPITFLGGMILKEAAELFQTITKGEEGGFLLAVQGFLASIQSSLPVLSGFEFNFSQYMEQGLSTLVQNLGSIFSSFAKMLLSSFVFLISFYFFLKDGKNLKDYLVKLSPLNDRDDEFIVGKLRLAVAAAVKGNLTIGLIQGFLTGIGLAIFGVPNPALWGGLAAVTALIPGVGTSIVLLPAVAYLFFTGNTMSAFGLLAWGVTAVGMIDNFLGPRLIGRGLHIHPLAIFLSVLGGLLFFGPMGFLLGPLVMSVCMSLIDIYFSLQKKDLEKNPS